MLKITILFSFFIFIVQTATCSDCKMAEDLANSIKDKVDFKNIKMVREKLWDKYLEKIRNDSVHKKEHEDKSLKFNGKTMNYNMTVVGDRESKKNKLPLYIALHGGGGAPKRLNDSQWQHMKRYYLPNVKSGIYVAPRGVTNTWNLHFVKESYVLYDRLIENMIAFENVDPDRVYVMGFSAGGDAVYQIAARMPDRWAGANMSAGHHNNVPPENLFNLPFLIQVGEKDASYKRNQAAVKYDLKLDELTKKNPGSYIHDIFVHANRGHNFLDNHPAEKRQKVLEYPEKLISGAKSNLVEKNTSAVRWVSKYTRNPFPEKIIWNLKAYTDRTGISKDKEKLWDVENKGRQYYWLDLGDVSPKEAGTDMIKASYDKKTNTITVFGSPKKIRVLLNEDMVDFSKEITVKTDQGSFKTKVKPSIKTMVRTLLERGDPRYIFPGEILIDSQIKK